MADFDTTAVTREEAQDYLRVLVDTVRTNDQKPRAQQQPSNIIDAIIAILATWRGVDEGSILNILEDDRRTQSQLIEDPVMVEAAATYIAEERATDAALEETTSLDQAAAATSPDTSITDTAVTTDAEPITTSSDNDFSWSAAGELYGFDATALESIEEGVEIDDADMANRDTAFGKSFLEAAAVLYEEREGEAIPSDWNDEDLANWADNRVSWFNNNIASVSSAALGGTARENAALMYLVEMNDRTEWTWGDMGEGGLRMIADPTNIITGIAAAFSFGTGGAAVEGAKQAARFAVKEAVTSAVQASTQQAVRVATREAVRQSAIMGVKMGAVEGALGGAIENTARQNVEMDVEDGTGNSLRENFSVGELAFATGLGTVIGAGAGGVLNGLTARLGATELAARFSTKMADWGFTWNNILGKNSDGGGTPPSGGSAPETPPHAGGSSDIAPSNTSPSVAAADATPVAPAPTTTTANPIGTAAVGRMELGRNNPLSPLSNLPNPALMMDNGAGRGGYTGPQPLRSPAGEPGPGSSGGISPSKALLNDVQNSVLDIELDLKEKIDAIINNDSIGDDIAALRTALETARTEALDAISKRKSDSDVDTVLDATDTKTLDSSVARITGESDTRIQNILDERMAKAIPSRIEALYKKVENELRGLRDEAAITDRIRSFLNTDLPNLKSELDAEIGDSGLTGKSLAEFNTWSDLYRYDESQLVEMAIYQNKVDARILRTIGNMGQRLASSVNQIPGLNAIFSVLTFDTDRFSNHIRNGIQTAKTRAINAVPESVIKHTPLAPVPTHKSRTVRHFVDHISEGTGDALSSLKNADAANFDTIRDQAAADYIALAKQLEAATRRFGKRGGPKITAETDAPMRMLAYEMGHNITGMEKDAIEGFAKSMTAFAEELKTLDNPAAFQAFIEDAAKTINTPRSVWEGRHYLIASTFEVGNQVKDGDKILPETTNLAQQERLKRAISQGFYPDAQRKLPIAGNRENFGYGEIENLIAKSDTTSAQYITDVAEKLFQVYDRGLEVDTLTHLEFSVSKLGDDPSGGSVQSNPIPRLDEIVAQLRQNIIDQKHPVLTKKDPSTGEHVINDEHFEGFLQRLVDERDKVWKPNPQGTLSTLTEWALGRNLDGRGHSRRENRKRIVYSALPTMIRDLYRESFSGSGATKPTDAARSYFKNNQLPRAWQFTQRYLRGHELDYDASFNGENGLYADPRAFRWQYKAAPEGGAKLLAWPWKQGSVGRHAINTVWRLSGLGLPELALFHLPRHAFGGLGVYAGAKHVRYAARAGGVLGMSAAIGGLTDEDSPWRYHPARIVDDPVSTALEVSTGTIRNILPFVGTSQAGFFNDERWFLPYGSVATLASEFTGVGNTEPEEQLTATVEAVLAAAPFNLNRDDLSRSERRAFDADVEAIRERAADLIKAEDPKDPADASKKAAFQHFIIEGFGSKPDDLDEIVAYMMANNIDPTKATNVTGAVQFLVEQAERLAAIAPALDTWLAANGSTFYNAQSDGIKAQMRQTMLDWLVQQKDANGNFHDVAFWSTDAGKALMQQAMNAADTKFTALDKDGNGVIDADEVDTDSNGLGRFFGNVTDELSDGAARLPTSLAQTKVAAANLFNTVTDHNNDGYSLFVDTDTGRAISGGVQSVWRAATQAVSDNSKTRGGREFNNAVLAFGGALFAPWALSKIPGFGWLNGRFTRTIVMLGAFFMGWKLLNGGKLSGLGIPGLDGVVGNNIPQAPDHKTPVIPAPPGDEGIIVIPDENAPVWVSAEGDDEGETGGEGVGDGTGGHIPQDQRSTLASLQRQGGVNQLTDAVYRSDLDEETQEAIADINDIALQPEFAVSSTKDTPEHGSEKTVAALKAMVGDGQHLAQEFIEEPDTEETQDVKVTLIHSTTGEVTETVHKIAGQTVVIPVNSKDIGPNPYTDLALGDDGPEAELVT